MKSEVGGGKQQVTKNFIAIIKLNSTRFKSFI